jgi:hypothetical protein
LFEARLRAPGGAVIFVGKRPRNRTPEQVGRRSNEAVGREFFGDCADVRRVYQLPTTGNGGGDDDGSDPDTYRHGFAPVTKLLYEVNDLLGRIDVENTRVRIIRWRNSRWTLLMRLWAALARNRNLASAEALSNFFSDLTEEQFWKAAEYPEFAELRARRFSDLDEVAKLALEERIRHLPPTSLWTTKLAAKDLVRYRHVRDHGHGSMKLPQNMKYRM